MTNTEARTISTTYAAIIPGDHIISLPVVGLWMVESVRDSEWLDECDEPLVEVVIVESSTYERRTIRRHWSTEVDVVAHSPKFGPAVV